MKSGFVVTFQREKESIPIAQVEAQVEIQIMRICQTWVPAQRHTGTTDGGAYGNDCEEGPHIPGGPYTL